MMTIYLSLKSSDRSSISKLLLFFLIYAECRENIISYLKAKKSICAFDHELQLKVVSEEEIVARNYTFKVRIITFEPLSKGKSDLDFKENLESEREPDSNAELSEFLQTNPQK